MMRQLLWKQAGLGTKLLNRTSTHLILAEIFLALDFFSGPFVQFPIAFVIPVALAGWFSRALVSYSLAVIQPIIRLGFYFMWDAPWSFGSAVINCAIRVGVLCLIAYLVVRTSRQSRALAQEVKVLQGILPICCYCKKIRDEENNWHPIEIYISQRSEANFSHGFCPECAHRYFGDIFDKRGKPKRSKSESM